MDRVDFACPACGNIITAPRGLAGCAAPCPRCKSAIASWPVPLVKPPSSTPRLPAKTSPAPRPMPLPPSPSTHSGSTGAKVFLGVSLACILMILAIMIAMQAWGLGHRIESSIPLFCYLAFAFYVYFTPTLIAGVREHWNLLAIFVMNFVLGWFGGLGWIIALIWACTSRPPK